MELTKARIKELKEAPYNPRIMPKETMEKLKQSLEQFGYVEPIIWNKRTGNVVGGNQRLKALKAKYHPEQQIEVVKVDMDLEREKALNIALNKIAGEWDEEKLNRVIKEINETDESLLDLTGLSENELAVILDKEPPNLGDLDKDYGHRTPVFVEKLFLTAEEINVFREFLNLTKTERFDEIVEKAASGTDFYETLELQEGITIKNKRIEKVIIELMKKELEKDGGSKQS
jgi:ParB-like chromosome segregation protein Spo0J